MTIAAFPFVLPVVFFVVAVLLLSVFGAPEPLSTALGGAAALLLLGLILLVTWVPIAYINCRRILDWASGAEPVSRQSSPDLWNLLEVLSIGAGLTMPAVRLIRTDAMNAYASGMREDSFTVTVTEGLLRALSRAELEAVLAHELAHIQNRDVRLMTISALLVGIIPIVVNLISTALWGMIFGILALYRSILGAMGIPTGFLELTYRGAYYGGLGVTRGIGLLGYGSSALLNLSLSRRREYVADAGAVALTKNPDALISALRRVSGNSALASAVPGISQMYFDFTPSGFFERILSTHPPIERRIMMLARFAGGVDVGSSLWPAEQPGTGVGGAGRDTGLAPLLLGGAAALVLGIGAFAVLNGSSASAPAVSVARGSAQATTANQVRAPTAIPAQMPSAVPAQMPVPRPAAAVTPSTFPAVAQADLVNGQPRVTPQCTGERLPFGFADGNWHPLGAAGCRVLYEVEVGQIRVRSNASETNGYRLEYPSRSEPPVRG
ncbi:MAG: M48 family metalloprotease [Bauldia sp.]|nr:M48 family metalloprotease [Bauldia sp.]